MQDPYLDASMRGWIVNTARKNYWRISGFELDDLIQEGYFCYYKCWRRYIGKPGWRGGEDHPGFVEVAVSERRNASHRYRYLPSRNPDKLARRHFSDLVKRTFNNRIYDLARKQSSLVEQTMTSLTPDWHEDASKAWEQIMPAQDEVATAALLLASAPKEIKQLFDLLINDALELSGYRRSGRKPRAWRETNNRRFCRLLGLDPSFDIVGLVNKHFLG